jgi:ribosomal protein S18 acetylase RimI-like enzyme
MAIKEESGKLFLSKFYILEQFRGKGYASAAFDFMEQFARQNSLSAIWLTVNKDNDHSISVYRHRGFEIVRVQVADIGGGYVMDDYIMEKTI